MKMLNVLELLCESKVNFVKKRSDVVNTDDDREAVNELIKNNIRLDKLYKSGQNQ